MGEEEFDARVNRVMDLLDRVESLARELREAAAQAKEVTQGGQDGRGA